jgi:hypothetical protein
MTSVAHSPECLKAQAAYKSYIEKWPDYCTGCGGWGQKSYTTNQSPIGSGEYWPMTESEPCLACEGTCPRCRDPKRGNWTGKLCKKCGWSCRDGGIPEVECYCGMEDEPSVEEIEAYLERTRKEQS